MRYLKKEASEKQLTSFPCRGKNIYSGKVQDVPAFIFLTLQVEGGRGGWEDEMEGVERGIVEERGEGMQRS